MPLLTVFQTPPEATPTKYCAGFSGLTAKLVTRPEADAGPMDRSRRPPKTPAAGSPPPSPRPPSSSTLGGTRQAQNEEQAQGSHNGEGAIISGCRTICVRSCADQVKVLAVDLVDQNPGGLDMAVAVVLPFAGERMVLISRQQGLPRSAEGSHRVTSPNPCRVSARASHPAGTAPRVPGSDGSDSQVFEQRPCGIETLSFALVGGA